MAHLASVVAPPADVASTGLQAMGGGGGRLLASAGEDGTVRLWQTTRAHPEGIRSPEHPLAILRGHTGAVWSVALSADGGLAASGSIDDTVRVWEAGSGACPRTLQAERRYDRLDITGLSVVTEAQRAALLALGAQEGSTQPPT